jgi:Mg-chelatase subunit ChlD
MASPTLSTSINRAWLREGASAVVFVALDVVPPPVVRTSPVALAVAIDASASMAGPKLEAARRAVKALGEALGPDDEVAIVAFRDRAWKFMTLGPAVAADALDEGLDRLQAEGETNVEAALKVAGKVLAPRDRAPARVARTVLLTDGNPTVGETRVEALAKQAAALRAKGVATSTVGIGEGYNEALLTELAKAGGGRWHHLGPSAGGLEALLGEELAEAGQVVGESPAVKVKLLAGAKVLQAFAVEPMVVPVEVREAAGGAVEVPLADLVARVRQTVVLRVLVPPVAGGRHALCRFEIGGAVAEAGFEVTGDAGLYGSETNPHARLLLTAAEGTVIARRALATADRTEIARSETIVKVVEADPALPAGKRAHPSVVPLVGALERTQDALEDPALTPEGRKEAIHQATVIERKRGGSR